VIYAYEYDAMLPVHELCTGEDWRLRWRAAATALRTVRLIADPGAPEDPDPFTGVTAVPFLVLCQRGRIAVRTTTGAAFTLREGEACWWAAGTWVACWHVDCPAYLRLTVDADHCFAAYKDHARRLAAGRLIDLYGIVAPRRPPELAGLAAALSGLRDDAWTGERLRAWTATAGWAAHDALIGDDTVDARWSALNALVRARWDSDLARSRVAADLGVAPETVSRLCRRHGGCTFLDLVRRERLAHAELLLRDHRRTVAEVAAACRLGSGTWLARLARRQRGRAPRRG